MPKPSDLLQGTLDLLILKSLAREPLHGWGIAKRIQSLSDEVLLYNKVPFTPVFIDWNSRAGSLRNGRIRKRAAAQSSIR